MARLGEMLRAARQDMGVSLAEVEQATKIRQRYLVALEDGDFASLPETIYVIGFLKTYARYLGLDPERTAQLFKEESGRHELPGVQPETRILREATKRSGLSPAGVSGVLMIAGLVLLLFFGYQQYLQIQAAVATPSAVAGTDGATPSASSVETPTAIVLPTATPPATATPTPLTGVTIELKILDSPCWVRVYADDKMLFQGTLQPGDKRVWQGREYVRLRVGYAPSADITYNGQHLGTLPAPGNVWEQEWRSQPAR